MTSADSSGISSKVGDSSGITSSKVGASTRWAGTMEMAGHCFTTRPAGVLIAEEKPGRPRWPEQLGSVVEIAFRFDPTPLTLGCAVERPHAAALGRDGAVILAAALGFRFDPIASEMKSSHDSNQ